MENATKPPAAQGQYIVRGQVRYASGASAKDVLVRAFDKDLRSEQLIGEMASRDGRYAIAYDPSKFSLAEAGSADLRISVCTADGREIASSPIRFNAKADETIDVTLPTSVAGPSEYDVLMAAIAPLLQGVEVADLTDDDLDFLAGDLAVDRQRIFCLRESAKQGRGASGPKAIATHIVTSVGSAVLPVPVFYGWFRLGLPVQPQELWHQPIALLIEKLKSAIDQSIVPASFAAELDQLQKIIAAIQQQSNLQPDQLAALADLGNRALADIAKNNPAQAPFFQSRLAAERRTILLDQLKAGSAALLTAIRTVDLGVPNTANQSLKGVLLDALTAAKATPAVINEATWRLDALDGSAPLIDPARPDLPLDANPLFSQSIGQGRLAKLANVAGIAQAKLQTILDRGTTLAGLRGDILAGLVKDNALSASEADKLGIAAATYRLTNGQWDAASAVFSAKIPALGGGTVTKAADLALLEPQDWEGLLTSAKVQPPANTSLQDHAKDLTLRAAQAFPVEALIGRIVAAPDQLDTKIAALQSFLSQPKTAPTTAPSGVDDMQRFANQHPGLQLHALFASGKTPADLAKEASARLDALHKVYTQNATVDLLALDFTPGSKTLADLDFGGISAEYRPLVLEDLKAFQRVFRVGGDAVVAKAVLDAGYPSAWSLANETYEAVKAKTGLADAQARAVYSAAKKSASGAAITAHSIGDWMRSGSLGRQFPVQDDASSYLRQLRGFADWFGSQDYCNCQDCQSVLSPAAYFVDLMKFIETNISTVFSSNHSHPLYLKVRRPDLWTLQLTCENTNDLVPYLDIINGVLETYIAKNASPTVVGDVYPTLASTVNSIHQPFHLPLQRIALYLKHFNHSRRDIGLALGLGEPAMTAATLDVSAKEYQLITTQNLNLASPLSTFSETLNSFFGDLAAVVAAGHDIDVQQMLRNTGWTRADLSALLATSFVNPANSITVNAAKKDSNSIQNDIELIHGLDKPALDRLHRFSRLHNRLPWSVTQTDLVLSCLTKESLGNGIDTKSVPNIATLLALNAEWNLPVDELCSYWSEIPQSTVDGVPSLLDRLFNQSPLLALPSAVQAKPWPAPTEKFLHPALNTAASGVSSPGDNTNDRLLAALKINDQQLVDLILGLAGPLALDTSGFALSLDNLTLLYRHARLATLLTLSIKQLFQLAQILGLGTKPAGGAATQYFISNLGDLTTLQNQAAWIAGSGYSLDEIGFILQGPVLDATPFKTAADVATDIVSRLADARAFEFADTVFTQLSGVADGKTRNLTDAESRALVAANVGTAVKKASEELPLYQLADGFDPLHGAISTTASGPQIDVATIRTLLAKFHPRSLLPIQLGMSLSVSPTKALELLQLAGVDLGSAILVQSMTGAATPPAALQNAVAGAIRYAVLYKQAEFDPQDGLDITPLTFIAAHRDIFHLPTTGLPADLESVRSAVTYASLTRQNDNAFATKAPNPDVNALHRSIDEGPTATVASAPTVVGDLAKALGTDAARIDGLRPNLFSVPAAPDRLAVLEQLRTALTLANDLGANGETLKLAVSDDATDPAAYKALQRAADGMYAAFRSKYPTDADFHQNVDNFDNMLRVLKRDALTDFALHAWPSRFPSLNSLSEYFLVDVALSGCARTSWVVAGISSLQLYVQRVLLNLEVKNDETLQVSANETVMTEWAWRKNFRVWQANRKIFLFPQDYMDPDLRRSKTPLFEKLQDALLQRNIDDQSVQDVYADYMAALMEISNLKIAGSFHDMPSALQISEDPSRGDILHLFGATTADPPTYYYRSISNLYYFYFPPTGKDRLSLDWGFWQKIDVQIPVRKVAPFVSNGTLYLLWTEITTQSQNQFTDGNSQFVGYRHKTSLKFSSLRLDGSWTAPQAVDLGETAVVDDPLVDNQELDKLDDISNSSSLFGLLAESAKSLAQKAVDPNQLEKFLAAVQSIPDATVSAAIIACFSPRYDGVTPHYGPQDWYTLKGFLWDQVYPDAPFNSKVTVNAFQQTKILDLWKKELADFDPFAPGDSVPPLAPNGLFYDGAQLLNLSFDNDFRGGLGYTERSDYLSSDRMRVWGKTDAEIADYPNSHSPTLVAKQLDGLPLRDFAAVNSSSGVGDAIVDVDGDLFYYLSSNSSTPQYVLLRLSTTVAPALSKKLFIDGINGLLSLEFQSSSDMKESDLPLTIWGLTTNETYSGMLAFAGPFGVYFREIFFHIPFLIAQHLSSQQQYAAAQRWYEYIFNPTTSDPIPSGASANQIKQIRSMEAWRYVEFRTAPAQTVLQMLADPNAIAAYQKDPFDPFAIGQQRTSAFQKAVVLKYIDNLLDWGDSLFSEFTMESVNEAVMLYLFAQDILGPRPADIGDCGENDGSPRDYEHVVSGGAADDFLVEIESVLIGQSPGSPLLRGEFARIDMLDSPVTQLKGGASNGATSAASSAMGAASSPYAWNNAGASYWTQKGSTPWPPDSRTPAEASAGIGGLVLSRDPDIADVVAPGAPTPASQRFALKKYDVMPGRGGSNTPSAKRPSVDIPSTVVRQGLMFCIPNDLELLARWDRVEDRLNKIRNCKDITGASAQLALFAPVIDPHMLQRISAAGLTLADVLDVTSGNLPPYRFTTIIEKARQFATTLQSFASQLLSALEKRDAEQLNQLRTVHEQNLLTLKKVAQQWEVNSAQDTLDSLQRQQVVVQGRKDYYSNLLQNGPIGSEASQMMNMTVSTELGIVAAVLRILGGISYLIPQLGAPTAMKWGGKEMGDSLTSFAQLISETSSIHQLLASASAQSATFERRAQEWAHQVEQAQQELDQLAKQVSAATFRRQITDNALDLHNKSIEQANEIFEFYQDRFTNAGLYRLLSSTLQTLYQDAFRAALSMTKLAEQAYLFERPEDGDPPLLTGSPWDITTGGLLAGETLLLHLQQLDQRFLETNFRKLEIEHSFSVAQFAPDELEHLRENGGCAWSIPEWFFDLYYPGQYNRRLKAVRVTIPCVTGPFINIGATLRLTGSRVRHAPSTRSATNLNGLIPQPLRHTVSIATSKGQSDAGVFEFSFRDERYMPFEGAGAVSDWELTLPKLLRVFDYGTISDVIVHLSYTADFDGSLKDQIETEAQGLVPLLNKSFNPLKRIFSLRKDMPNVYHRLISSPLNTEVPFTIESRHMPFFLGVRPLGVMVAKLHVVSSVSSLNGLGLGLGQKATSAGASTNFRSLQAGAGSAAGAFGNQDFDLGDVLQAGTSGGIAPALYADYMIKVTNSGPLAYQSPAAGAGAIDPKTLSDILLEIDYGLN